MVELIHNDVIIKLRCCLFGERLRVESLNRNKQIVDTLRPVVTDKHFSKVCILQHSTESIHALLENFLTVSHKQQTTRLIRILLAETFVIKRGNNSLACTSCGNNKVAIITTHLALCFQLIEDFLLIGIRRNVHRVHFGIVAVEVFFCLQRTCKTFLLLFVIVFKFIGIPVAFKGGCDLINGFRKILFRNLYVPFKAT